MALFVDVENWNLKPWEFAKTDRPKEGPMSQAARHQSFLQRTLQRTMESIIGLSAAIIDVIRNTPPSSTRRKTIRIYLGPTVQGKTETTPSTVAFGEVRGLHAANCSMYLSM